MNYHNITKDDMLNGDGLRVVLWVSGCSHHCKGCQNIETWSPCSGIEFDEEAKKEIFFELDKDYVSGITFSGGDPLMPCNREVVFNLIDEIKQKYKDKTIWVYTGFLFEEVKDLPFINKIDVLVDGEFMLDKLDTSAHWVGSTNQRVIDVKQTLKTGKVCLL